MIYGTSISITKTELAKVDAFCRQIQIKQSHRGSRDLKHHDTGKGRLLNNLVGKLGEVGAAKVVGGEVDFHIWATGAKGRDHFDPDIINPTTSYFRGKDIHVKTCHSKYGTINKDKIYPSARSSWTVDARDPILVQPSNRDILVLMFADEQGNVFSYAWVEAEKVQPFWRPCMSAFMAHKRALYLQDIKDMLRYF